MAEQQIQKQAGRIPVLDYMRALAIIHIVMYHYFLEWFGGSFLIVPGGIGSNLERLTVFKDGGVVGLIKNIFSFLFVYGFTSVNLFLVLSGFVLTYSLFVSGRQSRLKEWISFIWKRTKRILIPFYISVVLGALILFLRNAIFPGLSAPPIFSFLDFLKVFIFPITFFDIQFLQKFNGDYWFIPLILQLYLVFPLLYILLKKIGVKRFLLVTFLITVIYRFIAAYYLNTVPMGVIYPAENSYRLFSFFLPRLFEFCFGMGMAALYVKKPSFLNDPRCFLCFLAGIFLTFSGFIFNSYRWGWAFSDSMVAVGLFVLFLAIGRKLMGFQKITKFFRMVSDGSYETFLLHHYFLNYLLMPVIVTISLKDERGFWLFLPVFFISSVLLGEVARRLSQMVDGLLKFRKPV